MGDVVFSGKVFPLHKELTMGLKAVKIIPVVGLNFRRLKMTLSIEKALISVLCEMDALIPSDVNHVYKEAFVMAQAHVDVAAFNTAIGFQMVLNQMTFDGKTTELFLRNPILDGLCTAYDLNNSVPVFELLMHNANLSISFHDLIGAISAPDYAPINCGRAIDGLRQVISDFEPDTAKGWEQLRTALNVDKVYLKLVTDNAVKPRHGHHVFQDQTLTNEILCRSWTLMNRYLAYQLRGETPLVAPEFPLLSD